MSACHTCTSSICYSAHKSTNEMYERTKKMGITTIFDRWEAQQPQCGFGMQGVCCQLCSHGPCRITARAERAICGATADTIVARNLVRLAVHGAAAYSHHLEELAKTLKATAQGKTPFQIGDEQKLKEIASVLGLDTKRPTKELTIALADYVLAELRKDSQDPLALLEVFALTSRKEVWKKLGVIPGGVLSEIRDALTKSMTSIDTDPVDLLLTVVRLALATGYMGLVGTITVQDILLGTPSLVESQADLGIIDPETVNIVAHGHVPLMATAVIQAAEDPKLKELACQAGAKGIKVYGSMCTGQELMQRSATSAKGFAGQLSNWLPQEYYVATGAVDLVMMDMNCSIPGLKTVADHFHTKLVCVDRIVRMAGVEDHVDYVPEKVAEQARQLIKMAIEAYKERSHNVYIPPYKSKVVAGFGVETILKALGGSLDPLLDAIKKGAIRGIAAVVGCTNNRNGHDIKGLTIMREFLKNNVLVISAGCMSSAAEIEGLMDPTAIELCGDHLKTVCRMVGIPPVLNFGSCVDIGRIGVAVTAIASALGVDPSQLPVVASAPEYLEQKAVADGIFAVSFGLLTHIGPIPPVTGSELVTKILTQDIEQLQGGKVLVEEDPVKAVEAMVAHIDAKRKALGL
ncbi:carbon-monoxide dehydrogenase catalytic subunit [Thermanaeromonas toyohensis ToBE]|uniref:Carbon monoxide dehydrogenase n=1 Tax=Thermanaeromonas toyohensis ToBE TaxID=698762 RepID=A0A1W1W0D2_9FIRM|nr:anaerobic carbon-monoxide dehydrogenase catalytic subunit [Thermanaeromonas toyohensis]SMB99077.1 carbon-monoxide dehydrogenase catalytic subunit [Thermanaeromonas toyohensis ToBE]